jgi:hypothetical protein
LPVQSRAQSSQEISEQSTDSSCQIIITAEGITPTGEGSTTTAEGITTTAEGIALTGEGITPTVEGIATTAEGIAPTAEGIAPMAEGIAPTAEGIAPRAEGITAEGITVEGIAPKMKSKLSLQSSSPDTLNPSQQITREENYDSSCQILSDSSCESDESTASYETIIYPEHPHCKEYHLQTGQYSYTYKDLRDIPEDGLKYKTIIRSLELTEILDRGIGAQCGRLHWLYTSVKVYQDGWHTVMLTDGCIDRLIGHNAQQRKEATGDGFTALWREKVRQFTRITESRLKLMVHRDGSRDMLLVSAITILEKH